MFNDFMFPDESTPKWESVNWLQKKFMKWFNAERLKKPLTFPVETVNLLNDGNEYVDKEWYDFTAEMWSEGHSFFCYTSNSVDSLASCCFSGEQKCLTKSSNGVNFMSFEELYNAPYNDTKRNFTIFHNGNWVKGKVIRVPAKKMYHIRTVNNKDLYVTADHKFVTPNGDKEVKDITENDYLMFNSRLLNGVPELDKGLTFDEGYLIGMYLGDGSICQRKPSFTPVISLSLNESKYENSIEILKNAVNKIDPDAKVVLETSYNNVYPVNISSYAVRDFIREYVNGNYAYEKSLNMDCLLQHKDFRCGILMGYYQTDGGNSNRIYSTSKELIDDIECLATSLGLNTVINVSDRTDEPVVIRGESYKRNYPLYCIRWYDHKSKRKQDGVFKIHNNSEYYRVALKEEYDYDNKYVYCFEMENEDEPYFTLPNGVCSHNCRLKNEIQDNTFSYTLGAGGVSTGSKGVITMNLNRLIQLVAKDKGRKPELDEISDAVAIQVEKIHKYMIAYNEIVKDNLNHHMLPVYDAGYIALEKQYLTIGINGFVEGAEYLGIEPNVNDEYFKYGEAILKPIYTINKRDKTKEIMFNTEFVPAENLGVKNSKWDKKDGLFSPRDCYNSYFYRVEDENVNIIDKFILHGNRLTKYLDGRQNCLLYLFH